MLLVAAALPSPAGAAGRLLAPASKCTGQKDRQAKDRRQERAMKCLVDFAREHAGAPGLQARKPLARAAEDKAADIARCSFSHTACGRSAVYWPRRTGYAGHGRWLVGENIAWGKGSRGSARRVIKSWLASPPHREVLLMRRFEHGGIGLETRGRIAYWTLEAGCHGCR